MPYHHDEGDSGLAHEECNIDQSSIIIMRRGPISALDASQKQAALIKFAFCFSALEHGEVQRRSTSRREGGQTLCA